MTWKLPKIGLISAISLFVLDQLVKWLVIGPIGLTYEGDERIVLPIFTLRNVHNHGVSLGFLRANSAASTWLLVGMAVRPRPGTAIIWTNMPTTSRN